MVRAIALILTLVTGFTALVYQVAWQKFFAVLLGSHSEATAVVLGVFLGGLSSGYVLFGRLSRRRSRPGSGRAAPRLLRLYGVVEGVIGVYAMLFPFLFGGARALALGTQSGHEVVAFSVDVLLTVVLIGPPAVLMGGTIPLLTQALARDLGDATRLHARVYATNTAGAFLGALCAGFFIVPGLGLRGSMWVMGLINIAVGAIFLILDTRVPAAVAAEGPRRATSPAAWPALAAVALLSGFALMAFQTSLNRIAALSFGSSPFTFATVVAVFVLGIALGSYAVSALRKIPAFLLPASQWVLVLTLLLFYGLVPDGPYWAHVLRASFRDSPELFYPYHFTVFAALLLLLLLPLALAGATLPLLFHRLRREVGELGDVAGRLYGWNTLGSLLGALLGGYVLLLWLDLDQVFRFAVAALAVGAGLLTWRSAPRARGAGVALTAAVLVAAVLLPAWPRERLASGTFRLRHPVSNTYAGADVFYEDYLRWPADRELVAFYQDDPVASIAILRLDMGTEIGLAMVTNGKNDSSLPGDHPTTGLLAMLPAWLAQKCERAFVIGYGTGFTAGALAALDSTREVIVAEIARGVIDAAPLYESLNRGAAGNPKTRIVRGDAYRVLRRTEGSFDVITSEPSNPWVTGIEQLYSLEFFGEVRDKLSPGGVFVQWMHTYETDKKTLDLVLNTFRQSFGQPAVWYTSGGDLLLVGFKEEDRRLDIGELARRFARPDFRSGFAAAEVDTLPQLLVHELLPAGVLQAIDFPPQVHTILYPRLNHTAARGFYSGSTATPPPGLTREPATVGARNSLLRRWRAALGRPPSDAEREAMISETCSLGQVSCATLYGQWRFEQPTSAALEQSLEQARTRWPDADLSFSNLFKLASLFSAEGTRELPGEFDFARRVRESFTNYYFHGAPFDATAMHELWQRCADPRCVADRPDVLALGVARSGR